jgi:hypothetical protein
MFTKSPAASTTGLFFFYQMELIPSRAVKLVESAPEP